MPISMEQLDETYRRTYRRLVAGIFIVYGTVLLVALSVLIGIPTVASIAWQTAQAQFIGTKAPAATGPMRRVAPARPIQTVKAD